MKLLVNFTCFIDGEIYDNKQLLTAYMEYLFYNYSEQVEKYLKYKIIKKVIGLHEKASRNHFHLFILFDTEKSKVYKHLNDKIRRYNIPKPFQPVSSKKAYLFQKINISFMYEGEQKKFKGTIIPYDETAIRYPLKEGNTYYMYYGIKDEEIEILRTQAINEWAQASAIHQAKVNRKEIQEKENQTLLDYIKARTDDDFTYNFSTTQKIQKVMYFIIEKAVEDDTQFNINQLKNKAVNILRKLNHLTTDQIIELIYI